MPAGAQRGLVSPAGRRLFIWLAAGGEPWPVRWGAARDRQLPDAGSPATHVCLRNVAHRGLKRLIEDDDPRSLPAAVVGKLRHTVAFLEAMKAEDELRTVPTWKPTS